MLGSSVKQHVIHIIICSYCIGEVGKTGGILNQISK